MYYSVFTISLAIQGSKLDNFKQKPFFLQLFFIYSFKAAC